MRIYLVRHAAAVAKAEAERDEDRPLSDQGRDQARALASAFAVRGLELGAVVSSPLVRAHQTAAALADSAKPTLPDVLECDLLAPGELRPRKLSKYLAEVGVESVAIVGHMPELGRFAEWLIGAEKGTLPLAKSAAACFEFDGGPEKSSGELLWVVTPDWFQSPVKATARVTAGA